MPYTAAEQEIRKRAYRANKYVSAAYVASTPKAWQEFLKDPNFAGWPWKLEKLTMHGHKIPFSVEEYDSLVALLKTRMTENEWYEAVHLADAEIAQLDELGEFEAY